MTLQELKTQILSRMDEVVSSVGGSVPDHYSVEDFIKEGLKELLSIGPAYLLPCASISNSPTSNLDGSGQVELPSDCIRLDYFRMSGWKRPAEIIDSNNPLYQIQFNKHLRGDTNNPVAVVCAQPDGLPILEYYSLPKNATHTISKSVYIRNIGVEEIETLDNKLIEPLAWMVASLILGIGGESNASTYAYNRFSELITAIRYTTNKDGVIQKQQNNAATR